MCKDAIAHKIDFLKQLAVVLQGTVKPSMSFPLIPCKFLTSLTAKPILSDYSMLYT